MGKVIIEFYKKNISWSFENHHNNHYATIPVRPQLIYKKELLAINKEGSMEFLMSVPRSREW